MMGSPNGGYEHWKDIKPLQDAQIVIDDPQDKDKKIDCLKWLKENLKKRLEE